MKCPHCGKIIRESRKKVIDPAKVAQDLLLGFSNGLKGDELYKFSQRSMPKERRHFK